MSSLEHYHVIPILPREIPLSRIPLYIVHLRIGAGHYDAAIDNPLLPWETGESSCSSSTSKLQSCQNEVTSKEPEKVPITTEVGCRCGRGSARNKEERSFCCVYKDGCTVISGRLPAAVYFCRKGKKSSTDYPHWPITRTPKQKKIMLLYYQDKNSQTWSDEYSLLLFTKRKIDNIFC